MHSVVGPAVITSMASTVSKLVVAAVKAVVTAAVGSLAVRRTRLRYLVTCSIIVKMRWPSREKMLRRFWDLIDEVIEIMRSKKKEAELATLTDKAYGRLI